MDSSTEEEEEVFFESLEDILSSSSDSECVGEDKRHLDDKQHLDVTMGRAFNDSQQSSSKYDIWKSNPGSIFERRQRLLKQMGLKVEPEDPDRVMVLLDSAPSTVKLPDSTKVRVDEMQKSECQGAQLSNSTDKHNKQVEEVASNSKDVAWSMVRSRSDGTFSRLQGGLTAEASSPRLVRSGTSSPAVPFDGCDRLVDGSGAVLRSGSSGHGHPFAKPPLGVKKTGGSSNQATTGSADRFIVRKAQSYWRRLKITDKSGNTPDHADINTDSKDEMRQDGRDGNVAQKEEGDFCRIKDLDNGREFVVNEVGKDGSWNKLKELDTGRELTLEEFETSLGLSPIVQEVMRRQKTSFEPGVTGAQTAVGPGALKKKKGWFKVIKGAVRGSRDKGSQRLHEIESDDKEVSTERRSGSATDDSQDVPPLTTKRIKVHAHKKSAKEFSDLHMRQEIQAHQGAIWTMKFSLDGCYLATAGQDRVVRVWEIIDRNLRAKDSSDTSGELHERTSLENPSQSDSRRSGRSNCTRKSGSSNNTTRFPKLFLLADVSKCTFRGHTEDILDLSWSPSQSLLSSSMDKTVRLWSVSSRECLKVFTHNDYVTCIQFNPIDDGYFISGSLDGKVRIWSIQERQVVDWADLSEMVTAACYRPNGQEAVVGSYKGTCRVYKTSGNKLQLGTTFDVRSTKKKRSNGKKITGFQFIPGDEDKFLITSSDSRIWVYEGTEICSKYKGFRNTNCQISASCSSNGKYIVCASEDSRVCIWNYNDPSFARTASRKGLSGCYEDFSARHVLVAIPWPGMSKPREPTSPPKSKLSVTRRKNSNISESKLALVVSSPVSMSSDQLELDGKSSVDGTWSSAVNESANDTAASGLQETNLFPSGFDNADCTQSQEMTSSGGGLSTSILDTYLEDCCGGSRFTIGVPAQQVGNHGFFSDSRVSATWPEEKLPSVQQNVHTNVLDTNMDAQGNDPATMGEDFLGKKVTAIATAWGFAIVTAGLEGEIRTYQNYSFPVRL